MPQGVLVRVQSWAPMFFVYALKSETKNYIYVGLTDNVERRTSQHNAGYEKTTRPYRPFRPLPLLPRGEGEELVIRFSVFECRSGETGRHARFRGVCRKVCGFESRLRHFKKRDCQNRQSLYYSDLSVRGEPASPIKSFY